MLCHTCILQARETVGEAVPTDESYCYTSNGQKASWLVDCPTTRFATGERERRELSEEHASLSACSGRTIALHGLSTSKNFLYDNYSLMFYTYMGTYIHIIYYSTSDREIKCDTVAHDHYTPLHVTV